LSDIRVIGYEYDACCLGGKRKKRSVWWSSLPEFQGLVSFCDDSHPHLSWAPYQENGQWKFPSAQEAEYPTELCAKAAECVFAHWPRSPGEVSVSAPAKVASIKDHSAKIAGQSQPRGLQNPVVSEYGEVRVVISTIKPTCKVGDISSATDSGGMAGSKLLRLSELGENGTYQAAWGIYRTGPEFFQAAIAATHPLRGAQAVDDDQASVLLETLLSGPVAVAKQRMLALRHWESRAKELQPEEDKLRLNWSPENSGTAREEVAPSGRNAESICARRQEPYLRDNSRWSIDWSEC
jgi:hypothetical protein